MNIALFYQLRERLCSIAVAGCDTINEDFRLQRAVEEFEQLSKANKVFGRLHAMCTELLACCKPALLADCIALCDALAVTQGTFKDNSEVTEDTGVADCEPAEISYSSLKNRHLVNPKDPRIINEYLGNIKANIPDYIKQFIMNYGKGIVHALKQRIHTIAPKESGAIVKMVGELSGAEENEWYLSLIADENNPQPMRVHATENLRYDKSNAGKLLELWQTEKVAVKDAAALALVQLDIPESEIVIKKVTSEKFAKKNAELISISRSKTAIDFAVGYAEKAFEEFNKTASKKKYDVDLAIEMLVNKSEAEDVLYYLSNQDSKIIRMYYTCDILLQNLAENKDEKFRVLIENLYRRNPEYFDTAYFIMNAFENRRVKISDLPKIANKHRDTFIRRFENIEYDNVKKCYMCGNNVIDDGRIYDILEFLTDTSYFAKTNIWVFAKNKKEDERFRDLCSELACRTINKIFESSAEQDRDRISEIRLDFFKAVMKKTPNGIAFVTLCQNEPQYIIENPHLLEDLVMYKLTGGWFGSVFDEIPRDIIDTAVIPLYKKLKTLKDKKYSSGNVSMQIKYIERYLENKGYDIAKIKF